MQITSEIAIRTAHRIVKYGSDNRYLLVSLADPKDKYTIFKNAKNLKEQTNVDGQEYYINNQVPTETAEDNRKKRQKIKINKTLIDAQQQNLQLKRGELIVEGAQFQPKVAKPSCTEVLEMHPDQLKKVFSYKLQGAEYKKSGSSFHGFPAKVHTIEDVLCGHQQPKYRFMDCSHIMCVYRILDPDVAHMTDSIDGGELGDGCRLVQMLLDQSCENLAVYVIRRHRGPNIGPSRFELILQAAKSAIGIMPIGLA